MLRVCVRMYVCTDYHTSAAKHQLRLKIANILPLFLFKFLLLLVFVFVIWTTEVNGRSKAGPYNAITNNGIIVVL